MIEKALESSFCWGTGLAATNTLWWSQELVPVLLAWSSSAPWAHPEAGKAAGTGRSAGVNHG